MTLVLEANALGKNYRLGESTVRAVSEVSLAIRAGEFIALVGPSGSGKTTLLAMLAALLRPTSGRIAIDGRDLADLSEGELTRFRRENIGFTFQGNNLVGYLTALENVELMLRLNGRLAAVDRQRARDLLVRLGLGDRLDSLPRQLSGGQQQRVAIARALVHRPAIVLADEPTASLDSERAHQVVETFAQMIHEQRRAGIMVTHDLRMCRYADRTIQMMDGRVIRELASREAVMVLVGESPHEARAMGPAANAAVAIHSPAVVAAAAGSI